MKVIIEGSSSDVRSVLSDRDSIQAAAEHKLEVAYLKSKIDEMQSKLEESERKNEAAGRLIASAEAKAAAERTAMLSCSGELKRVIEKLTEAQAKIQHLEYDAKVKDPVRLTEAQEQQIDQLFRDTLAQYKAEVPLKFFDPESKKTITSTHMLEVIFGELAKGNRVVAIKRVKEATGMGINAAKNLVDNALMAFGCSLSGRNTPSSVLQPAQQKPDVTEPSTITEALIQRG